MRSHLAAAVAASDGAFAETGGRGGGWMQFGRRFSPLPTTWQASRTFWQHALPQMTQSPVQQNWSPQSWVKHLPGSQSLVVPHLHQADGSLPHGAAAALLRKPVFSAPSP